MGVCYGGPLWGSAGPLWGSPSQPRVNLCGVGRYSVSQTCTRQPTVPTVQRRVYVARPGSAVRRQASDCTPRPARPAPASHAELMPPPINADREAGPTDYTLCCAANHEISKAFHLRAEMACCLQLPRHAQRGPAPGAIPCLPAPRDQKHHVQ